MLASLQLSGDQAYLDKGDNSYGDVFESRDRTVALVLRALLAYDGNHPMAPALLRGLLANRKNLVWSSTQASAWALSAIADYQGVKRWAKFKSDDRVWLEDALIASTQLSATQRQYQINTKLSQSLRPSTLIFDHRGPGSLFYSAQLTFERPHGSERAVSRGFDISNSLAPLTYFDTPPASKPVELMTNVQVGQMFLGVVTVFSPVPRSQIVVQVPLPAGFEPIDPSLNRALGFIDRDGSHIARSSFFLGPEYVYQEVHDDRINFYVEHLEAGVTQFNYLAQANTLGRFHVPNTQVAEMYRPEFYARTAASTLTVAAKQISASDSPL